jgi:hypothetical protein
MDRSPLAAWKQRLLLLAGVLIVPSAGCATSLCNAVPVQRLPPDLVAPARDCKLPINFALLRPAPLAEHIVGPGDVLGIYVQQVLGAGSEPAVYYPAAPGELVERSRRTAPSACL